jgi:hypothetical protein
MGRPRTSSPGPIGDGSLSFRQLATLLTILVVGIVLAPIGVQAAGQLASIVDSDSDTDIAQVDAGKLRVGDGSGNLTVDGTVQSELPLGTSFVAHGVPANSRAVIAGRFLTTQKFAIGSLTMWGASSTTGVALELRNTVSGSCSSSGTLVVARAIGNLAAGQTLHLTYPMPMTFSNFVSTWCLYAKSTGSSFLILHVGRSI